MVIGNWLPPPTTYHPPPTTLCHRERNALMVALPLAAGPWHAAAGHALGIAVHHGLRSGRPRRVRIREQSALPDTRHHARDVHGFRVHQPPLAVWPRIGLSAARTYLRRAKTAGPHRYSQRQRLDAVVLHSRHRLEPPRPLLASLFPRDPGRHTRGGTCRAVFCTTRIIPAE